ncbi:MAG: MFS transporter, partial [Pseudomonadota bacterium]
MRWISGGFLLTFFSSFGQTFFISLFAGGIRADFALSDGEWGAVYTVATIGSALVLAQAGRLADTVAPRRLVLGIAGLYLAAIAAMAFGTAVWMLVLAVFGLRLAGQGLISHLSMTLTARWFRANRGRALAVTVLGYPAGEALLPPLAVALIGWIGWRETWLVAGALLGLVILPLILALLARGDRVPTGPAGEGGDGEAAGMEGRHWTRAEVLRHWSFWALMPGVLAPSFIGTVAFFHQVHLSGLRGWDLSVMALGYPAYAAVSVVLSLISGPLIDRIGPVALLPVYLLPIGAAISALMLPGGEGVWIACLLGIGVSQGVVITLLGALWPRLYGTRHIGGIKALTVSAM